jgi:predicted AAA+ superfamily ATPase
MLRGARQVGKSSAVRHLGKSFKYFVEINFEDVEEDVKNLFKPGISPQEICKRLSFYYDTPIIAGETLLFLDEIQACIPAISKLRYFFEQFPELHVIAAGSLLEFALEELPSFGVGRIRSVFMYPFSFDTGIFQRVLGLDISHLLLANNFKTINGGVLAEVFVGLELLKASSCYHPTALYYWQREKHQSHAQIDFVIQKNEQVIPIEVKSGTGGKMQSLFLFLQEKKLEYGVRTFLENFAQYGQIKVYPLYAISNLLNLPMTP